MKYTSLLLDLDDTLLDFKKAEARAVALVLERHSLPHDEATVKLYSAINQSYWERFERGEIPKNAIYTGRFDALAERIGAQIESQAVSTEYCVELANGFFTVEGTFDVLDYLKDKGYRLYAATNGLSKTQYKRIEGSGLKPYFEGVFVSEDAGAQKPEKAYYDYVISNIPEKDKSKMLIVGDSQSSDILGALNAGIDACWFNPAHKKGKYSCKFEISSLYELKNIL